MLNRYGAALLCGVVLVLLCLSLILRTGLYSDDKPNFQRNNAQVLNNNAHPWQNAVDLNNRFMAMGRLAPLAFFFQEYSCTLFTSVRAYKGFILACNLAAIIAFLFLLKTLRTPLNAGIWLLGFAAVMQFRITYHDAYTTINGMYQAIAVLSFTSATLFNRGLQTKRTWYYVLALVVYITAHLFSEMGLLAFVLIILSLFVLKVPLRTAFKSGGPFALVTLGYLGCVYLLRQQVPPGGAYIGIVPNTNPADMWLLLCKQVYAALPLSALHQQVAIGRILWHQLSNPVNAVLVAGIALAGFGLLYAAPKKGMGAIPWRMGLWSLALIIFPSVLVAPSVKYQQEVQWGMAYLPVYLQNFGTATLLALLLQAAFKSTSGFGAIAGYALGFALLLAAAVTLLFNSALINKRNYNEGIPVIALYEAEKQGALKGCTNGATIVLANEYYGDNPAQHQRNYREIYHLEMEAVERQHWVAGSNAAGHAGCFLLECPPGNPIITSVYRLNCATGQKEALLRQFKWPCSIDLIPEEQAIYYKNW